MRNLIQVIHENIDEKERTLFDKFVQTHKEHHHGRPSASGTPIWIEISENSIGGYIIVMHCLGCGKSMNITDFDSW